jgi:hypothetical protein
MLQAGRSRARFHMSSLNVFNLPNPCSHTRPWGLLSLYQKQKKMFLGSRARVVCKVDNFTAVCESNV